MKNNIAGELGVGIVFILLLLILLNPFEWWMPTMTAMTLTVMLVVVFALFTAFVWRERPHDEREHLHRSFAGRLGFLAGTCVLVAGIVVQESAHELDPWLPIALGSMIIAKIIGFVYSRTRC